MIEKIKLSTRQHMFLLVVASIGAVSALCLVFFVGKKFVETELSVVYAPVTSVPSRVVPEVKRVELPHTILEVFPEGLGVVAPFRMPAIRQPVFPDRICNIVDYGAVEGGQVKNTKAIASAIDRCFEDGGGEVFIPDGVWLSGAIHLKSTINLHLADKATLIFSDDPQDYLPVVFSRYEGVEVYNYSPLIYADGAENIAVTGKGKLIGQGEHWWKLNDNKVTRRLYDMGNKNTPIGQRVFGRKDAMLRPPFIQFVRSKSILLEGFSIENGPMWTIDPVYSQDIVIRGIHVFANGLNGDGIDIDSSKNVLIENSDIDTNDDSIVLKSGRSHDGVRVGVPTENVVIRNNQIRHGHGGIAIGSELAGGVRNVFVYGGQIEDNLYGIRVKSARTSGTVVENLWFQNMQIDDSSLSMVQLNMVYGDDIPVDATGVPVFRQISFSNVHGTKNKKGIEIYGLAKSPVQSVSFAGGVIGGSHTSTLSYVDGVVLDGIQTETKTGKDPALMFDNSSRVVIKNAACPVVLKTCVSIGGRATRAVYLGGYAASRQGDRVMISDKVDRSEVVF